MTRLLMIYPGIGVGSFQSTSGEGCWIHHGVGLLATYARSRGYPTSVLDMRGFSGWNTFKTELDKYHPDMIGISCSYADFEIVKELIQYIRDTKLCEIVVGGFVPSIFPEKFDTIDVDHVIVGEGELALIKVLEGTTERVIRGEKVDLDTLPFVNREFFDYKKELNTPFTNIPTPHVTMIAGRGCPFLCTFCQGAENKIYGKPHRIRSVDHVIGELKELRRKYDFKSITFWDDTFVLDKKWILDFCDSYQQNGFTARFTACNRADLICNNEDVVKRLKEIGLQCFVIGFESGSDRLLQFLKKGTTVAQNLKAAEICHKHGIEVFSTFMLGLPTETKEESQATIDMIKQSRAENPSIFYFTPIPGTEIYDYCVENDLILRTNMLDIERTMKYRPTIKGIDYAYLDQIRSQWMVEMSQQAQLKAIFQRRNNVVRKTTPS